MLGSPDYVVGEDDVDMFGSGELYRISGDLRDRCSRLSYSVNFYLKLLPFAFLPPSALGKPRLFPRDIHHFDPIFVIFVLFTGSEQQSPCFAGWNANSSFSPLSSKNLSIHLSPKNNLKRVLGYSVVNFSMHSDSLLKRKITTENAVTHYVSSSEPLRAVNSLQSSIFTTRTVFSMSGSLGIARKFFF